MAISKRPIKVAISPCFSIKESHCKRCFSLIKKYLPYLIRKGRPKNFGSSVVGQGAQQAAKGSGQNNCHPRHLSHRDQIASGRDDDLTGEGYNRAPPSLLVKKFLDNQSLQSLRLTRPQKQSVPFSSLLFLLFAVVGTRNGDAHTLSALFTLRTLEIGPTAFALSLSHDGIVTRWTCKGNWIAIRN